MKSKITIMSSAAGYDLGADDYDKKEKYLNSFEQGKFLPLLGDVVGQKILDVGAGTGRISIPLARSGAIVTALDVSPAMLRVLARKHHRVATVIGDGESLPFDSESFDVVVAAFFLVHLSDPTRFFDEAYRVLKPGGRLLVSNINQKDPPEIKTKSGIIKIESYYHRPDKIIQTLNDLAFGIEKEVIVKEKNIWINQMILAKK